MPSRSKIIDSCHACGHGMDVTAVAPFTNVSCPSCGEATRVKRQFGPYTLVRRHEVGGMSMVFIAQDSTLKREVALKILNEELSSDQKRIKAFAEEARITASFSHPNVVRVLTTGSAFGRLYIAMEFIPCGHLEQKIRKLGKIPELQMLPLAIEIAQGLKAASAAGLIHRDVKPGNILIDAAGHARIVDFGLALVTHGGKAKAKEVWATPYYVPPETISGNPEDIRSDIYAFGATLYHALAGVPSCGEETMSSALLREAKKKVVPLGIVAPSLSANLCKIVERAMAYEPKERFSSYDPLIEQLEQALQALKSDAPIVAETSGSAARRRARKRRREVLTLVLASTSLALAAVGAFWWIRHQPSPLKAEAPPAKPVASIAAYRGTDYGVLKKYSEARAYLEMQDFELAVSSFLEIHHNVNVPEPTRSWAGVEAVVAAFLSGESTLAKQHAEAVFQHTSSIPVSSQKLGDALTQMLDQVRLQPAIPVGWLDTSNGDSQHVMAWMMAGLKNWEQGMSVEALGYFTAVAGAKIPADAAWLDLYQRFASYYIADHRILSSAVFQKLPADLATCHAADVELENHLKHLKTQGRARYNIRAWQLDVAKHAKRLAASE